MLHSPNKKLIKIDPLFYQALLSVSQARAFRRKGYGARHHSKMLAKKLLPWEYLNTAKLIMSRWLCQLGAY